VVQTVDSGKITLLSYLMVDSSAFCLYGRGENVSNTKTECSFLMLNKDTVTMYQSFGTTLLCVAWRPHNAVSDTHRGTGLEKLPSNLKSVLSDLHASSLSIKSSPIMDQSTHASKCFDFSRLALLSLRRPSPLASFTQPDHNSAAL
jgi:hypothetical protein